jgi:hypothetical protein
MRAGKTSVAGAVMLASVAVAGCGGGGSSDPVAGSPAQGAYEGTFASGFTHLTMVLDDNRYYTLYGEESGGVFYIAGLLQGSGNARNGSFTSTDLRDYSADGTVTSGSLSASYVAGVSFNGSVTQGPTTIPFTSAPPAISDYHYDTPANLSNITGSWAMLTMFGTPVALNIQANGAFFASDDSCQLSGNITPRASGKNVFDVNGTFSGDACTESGQSINGIAIESTADGESELIVAATTTSRSDGTVLFGVR